MKINANANRDDLQLDLPLQCGENKFVTEKCPAHVSPEAKMQSDPSPAPVVYTRVVPHTTSPEQMAKAIVKDVEAAGTENAVFNDEPPFTPAELGGDTPPVQEWIVEGLIPANATTGLYGPAGVGKSLIVQQLGYALSARTDWCGLSLPDRDPVQTLMVMGEDKKAEIHRRHASILDGLQIRDQAESLAHCLMWAQAGNEIALGHFDCEGVMHLTDFYARLVNLVVMHKVEFLTLDTIADMFVGNENDRAQVNQFIKNCLGGLRRTAEEATGKPLTILIIGHSPKAGVGYSGSTAWNIAVQARLEIQADPHVADIRKLYLPKSTFAPANDSGIPLIMENGAFVPLGIPGADTATAITSLIVELVTAGVRNGQLLQDASKHPFGLVDVCLRSDLFTSQPKHQILAVLKNTIRAAREGSGPLRITRGSAAKDTPSGFVLPKKQMDQLGGI